MLHRRDARRRGVAIMLVMFALAVGTVLALTFLSSQTTSTAIAHNMTRQTQARAVAEGAVDAVLQYMNANPDWRDDYTNGVWSDEQAMAGGTFRVKFTDEVDGDLADDPTQDVTMSVHATYDGVSHVLPVTIKTQGSASIALNVLYITDQSTLNSDDEARIALMQSWGYTVVTAVDTDSLATLTTLAEDADVAYVSEEVWSSDVNTKLNNLDLGVVNEEPAIIDDLMMATGSASYGGYQINIINNSHAITSGLPLGTLTICTSSNDLMRAGGTEAAGLTTLATGDGSYPVLSVLDIGDLMTDGNPSPQRRVALPWGGNSFAFTNLTADAQTIMKQALEWAAGDLQGYDALARWTLDETSGVTANDVFGNQDGTYVEGPALGQIGVAGNAITLDASLDRVTLPDELFTGLTKMSFSVWLKTTKTGEQAILSGNRSDMENAFLLFLPNSTTLRFYHEGSTTDWTFTAISDGQWHQLFVVYNADTDKTTAYLDGESLGTKNASLGAVSVEHIVLGEEQDSVDGGYSSSQAFVGSMDDAWLFDRALTDEEVLEFYEMIAGDATTPELVALYEFEEPEAEEPNLVGHWKLDEEASGSGGQIVVGDTFRMINQPQIDSYNSSLGTYAATAGSNAWVATNSTATDSFYLSESSKIYGDGYGGAGGSVGNIFKLTHSATITGSMDILPAAAAIDIASPPSLPYAGSHYNVSSNYTINQSFSVDSGYIYNGPTLTVSGHQTIVVNGTLTLQDGSVVIPSGSSLTLYVGGQLNINNQFQLNNDPSATDRLTVILFNEGDSNNDLNFTSNGKTAGSFYIGDDATLGNSATLYGKLFVADDLVVRDNAWVHLDEALGGGGAVVTAVDDAVGNDGQYQNGVQTAYSGFGDGGTAAWFDGTDDYIEVAHNAAYLLDEGTVAFWVYPDDLNGTQCMISKDSTDFDTGGHLRIYAEGSAVKVRLQSTSSSYYLTSSSGALTTGAWHHVAVGFGSDGARLYVDGVLVDTDSYTGGLGTTSGGSGNYEPWTFGVDQWKSGNLTSTGWELPFHGRLDDVRVYDQNFTEDQADNLYQGYDPGPGKGSTVVDTSGAGDAIDLVIANPANVTWIDGGGLTINSATTIATASAPTRLATDLMATNRFTLEAEFTPANITQDGPARIITYSDGTSNRNFHLGQTDAKVNARLRTEFVSSGTPEAESGDVLTPAEREHVIVTYNGENLLIYRNGTLEVTAAWTGDFDNWNSTYTLLMANEVGNARPWLGTLHRIAIWDQAVNSLQADNLFNNLLPGSGGTDEDEPLSFTAEWMENP